MYYEIALSLIDVKFSIKLFVNSLREVKKEKKMKDVKVDYKSRYISKI